jgi:hypothetical protein
VTVPLEDVHGPVEARSAEVGGTRIHSVRLRGFVVTTEAVFAPPGKRLIMRHYPDLTADPLCRRHTARRPVRDRHVQARIWAMRCENEVQRAPSGPHLGDAVR